MSWATIHISYRFFFLRFRTSILQATTWLTQPKPLGSIVRVTELVGSQSAPIGTPTSITCSDRTCSSIASPATITGGGRAARIPLHRYRGLNNSRGEARRSRLPPLGRSLCHRFVRRRGASPGRGAALTKALIASLGPPAAQGLGNAKHDELGEGYALDEQQGAVSAEDAERAFGLACPVRGQDTRGRLNQPKIFVGSSGQDRGVPEPEDDDQNERAYERGGFKCAAPDPPRNG